MERKFFISIFMSENEEVIPLDLKQQDLIEHASQILNGLRDFCVVLDEPELTAIPPTVFVVMQVGLEKAQSLITEALGKKNVQEDKE